MRFWREKGSQRSSGSLEEYLLRSTHCPPATGISSSLADVCAGTVNWDSRPRPVAPPPVNIPVFYTLHRNKDQLERQLSRQDREQWKCIPLGLPSNVLNERTRHPVSALYLDLQENR